MRLPSFSKLAVLSTVFLAGAGAIVLASSTGGCDGPAAPIIDANFPDVVYPDAAIVHPVDERADPCEAPMRVTGTLDGPTSVMLDTTMTETRPRDLGLLCGNPEARVWARQEVIAYTVPGTGPVGVRISTANMGTRRNFNTVIQVRRECRRIPTETFTCFDDVSRTEPRAIGGFSAMGGETVYVYVTGHSEPEAVRMEVDEGPVQVTFEAAPNTPPTLTSARYRVRGTDSVIDAAGTDAEGNFEGLSLFLYNSMGRINLAGAPNGILLSAPDAMGMDWSARIEIPGSDLPLVEFCRRPDVMCTRAGIVAFDRFFATSAERSVTFDMVDIVGLGARCDRDHVCANGLVCNAMMTCEPTPEAMAACAAATNIEVPTPSTATTRATATAMLPNRGLGLFTAPASCTEPVTATDGQEHIFRVVVPEGDFDLTFRTDLPGTGSTDTVLYVRRSCADATTTIGCHDDIARGMLGSTVTVSNATAGEYFAFVESYNGSGGPVEIEASLKPVLPSGASCDPRGMDNRCARGVCPMSTMICP